MVEVVIVVVIIFQNKPYYCWYYYNPYLALHNPNPKTEVCLPSNQINDFYPEKVNTNTYILLSARPEEKGTQLRVPKRLVFGGSVGWAPGIVPQGSPRWRDRGRAEGSWFSHTPSQARSSDKTDKNILKQPDFECLQSDKKWKCPDKTHA